MSTASAQPGIDLRGRLDASPGGTLLGNKPGPSISRTPPEAYRRPDALPTPRADRPASAGNLFDYPLPLSPPEIPQAGGLLGDPNGMTLDSAAAKMVACNFDIVAARSAVAQARSDIVTAGLRANPQFYADMQAVPYRTGGPGQADVNIAHPLDVSGKRRTRVNSAVCVLRSVEWGYQNFVRAQTDTLYSVFVDALAAQVTVDELTGPTPTAPPTLDPTQGSPLDEAQGTLRDRRLALAQLLNVPDPKSIRLKGLIFDPRSYHPGADDDDPAAASTLAHLKQFAREHRPDLLAKRWDSQRSLADVEAVMASRFDDVTFLVQPYTYSPSLPNHVGWALGLTVPMPTYNRQQGNLAKARQIVAQTSAQLASLEQTVAADVENAYNAVRDTHDDTERFRKALALPITRPPRDVPAAASDPRLKANIKVLNDYVDGAKRTKLAQDRRNYYNAILLHRKSLLRMNTACGAPVGPTDPLPPARRDLDNRPVTRSP